MDAQDAIDLLKRMIEIRSLSREENDVADMLEKYVTDKGYHVERCGNNLWTKSKKIDAAKPTILLDAHIDTVKPNPSWTLDPFTPTIIDGKLYGLGSNDTGGSVVSMLTTFLNLDANDQAYNLIWMASAEEENTGKGGIQSVVDRLGRVDLAIVGEPTGMNAAIAEKGLMVIDCTAKGKAGHAARGEGVNAIYKAMDDIDWFRTYRFEKVSPLLGEVKMTVTGINAGTLHNVVPAECKFMVDIRINECYSNAEVFETIKNNVKCDVVPRSFNLNSSSIAVDHPFVERCKKAGRTTYGSPTTSNQAVIPFTSIKMGPGDSARSHTADEYIYLDEIVEGIDIFVNLLDGYSEF